MAENQNRERFAEVLAAGTNAAGLLNLDARSTEALTNLTGELRHLTCVIVDVSHHPDAAGIAGALATGALPRAGRTDARWVQPQGRNWTVEEIDTQILAPSSRRPAARNIICISAADALGPNGPRLLKTIEEPTAATTFVLLCTNPDALHATIRGRSAGTWTFTPALEGPINGPLAPLWRTDTADAIGTLMGTPLLSATPHRDAAAAAEACETIGKAFASDVPASDRDRVARHHARAAAVAAISHWRHGLEGLARDAEGPALEQLSQTAAAFDDAERLLGIHGPVAAVLGSSLSAHLR